MPSFTTMNAIQHFDAARRCEEQGNDIQAAYHRAMAAHLFVRPSNVRSLHPIRRR